VGGEHPIAIPDDADADVREFRVDDVCIVARRGNERIHNRTDIRPGADVFAELRPRVGHTGTDWTGMADEGTFTAHAIFHRSRPAAGKTRELHIKLQCWEANSSAYGVHLCNVRRFV